MADGRRLHRDGVPLPQARHPALRWAMPPPPPSSGHRHHALGCFMFGCDYGARSACHGPCASPGPTRLRPHGSPPAHHVQEFGLIAAPMVVSVNQRRSTRCGRARVVRLADAHPRYRRFRGRYSLVGARLRYPAAAHQTVRDDEDRGLFISARAPPLSTSQIIGLTSVVLGLVLLVVLLRRYRQDPGSSGLGVGPGASGRRRRRRQAS